MDQRPTRNLYFNGVCFETSDYAQPPVDWAEYAEALKGTALPEDIDRLKAKAALLATPHLAPLRRFDEDRLDQTGWGIIFPPGDPAEMQRIRDELAPLLELRRQMAGDRYREFSGEMGYLKPASKDADYGAQTSQSFLGRNGSMRGPVDPRLGVPYYLVIVGSPEQIPFEFQTALDVDFAVGRLWFPQDLPGAYRRYAEAVVAAETRPPSKDRRAAVFVTRHAHDPATEAGYNLVAKPLLVDLQKEFGREWKLDEFLGEKASKASLVKLLGGENPPAFLFTATHGVEFKHVGDPRQRDIQGALVCREWPGPRTSAPSERLSPDCYLSAADIPEAANLTGMVSFLFGCYTAGTPTQQEFFTRDAGPKSATTRLVKARQPILSALAWRMLAHAGGGASAVIGHVGAAYAFSDDLNVSAACTSALASSVIRLLRGKRVGAAMEDLNDAYASFATAHADHLRQARLGSTVAGHALPSSDVAYIDARNYTVVGDPAVRIGVNAG